MATIRPANNVGDMDVQVNHAHIDGIQTHEIIDASSTKTGVFTEERAYKRGVFTEKVFLTPEGAKRADEYSKDTQCWYVTANKDMPTGWWGIKQYLWTLLNGGVVEDHFEESHKHEHHEP